MPSSRMQRSADAGPMNSTVGGDGSRMPLRGSRATVVLLRLFQLDQRAVEILRVEEQHRLAMRADLGIAVAEHAGASRHQPVAGGDDVVDLIADMMHAAVGVALQKRGDGRAGAKWLQQFDLGVRQTGRKPRSRHGRAASPGR